MHIRTAVPKDYAAILDIYNYEIVSGTATFDIHLKDMEDMEDWFDAHNVENHPLIVAEEQGQVIGWASLSTYRPKHAYAGTVELSIYTRPEVRGRGVGSALMQELIRLAKADPRTHVIVSVITGNNNVSRQFHTKFGFKYAGTLQNVGYKFNQFLDIHHYVLQVDEDLEADELVQSSEYQPEVDQV